MNQKQQHATEALVVRLAQENRDWEYRRILGVISEGHKRTRGTIANALRKHGIEPAPDQIRKIAWQKFLTRQRKLIVAADFFTIEVLTPRDCVDGLVKGSVTSSMTGSPDRDPLFTAEFVSILADSGVKAVKLPVGHQNPLDSAISGGSHSSTTIARSSPCFYFFTVPTRKFRTLYCFFVIEHGRRRLLHFNCTEIPPAIGLSGSYGRLYHCPAPAAMLFSIAMRSSEPRFTPFWSQAASHRKNDRAKPLPERDG